MPARPLACAVLAALAVAGAGCLGDDGDQGERADGAQAEMRPRATAEEPVPSPVSRPEPGAEDVIRAWADTLRRGDVAVIATEDAPHGFVIATFRLTERPGRGRCGSGTGATARTALLVRDGHITDWLRVPDGAAPELDATPA